MKGVMDLEYNVITTGSKMVVELEGRLDTTTAPKLDAFVRESLGGISELCIAMEKLEYISSAGLRVLLAAQKIMDKQGRMVIPQFLREEAGIEKDLVTIGVLDHLEIWAKEVYDAARTGGLMKSDDFVGMSGKFPI